jgi:hypothetical protein
MPDIIKYRYPVILNIPSVRFLVLELLGVKTEPNDEEAEEDVKSHELGDEDWVPMSARGMRLLQRSRRKGAAKRGKRKVTRDLRLNILSKCNF